MTTTLYLLGPSRLIVDGQPWPWLPDRRTQLLSYLAGRADWVARETLLTLFWPDRSADSAGNNLRQLLRRVRALNVPGLEIERGRLRWTPATDVAAFVEAVADRRWEEALGHYEGPLLDGLDNTGTGDYAAWLEGERARLRGLWRTSVLRRAEQLREQHWHLEAAGLLETLVNEDLDEEALRLQVGAFQNSGGRERALQACERFIRRLRDELNLGPEPELASLLRSLQMPTDPEGAPVGQGPPPPALPTTSFVGRDPELAEVTRLLVGVGVRLLTVSGPGGIGKTRLALEAARRLAPNFPDGVYVVPLMALGDPTLIASSLADALGLALAGQDPPLQQVTRFIGRRRLLLVFDNHEHLLGGVEVAQAVVRACPNVRLLVTSRERLGLEDEWLLPLVGLEHPDPGQAGEVDGPHFDAVRLFLDRARQVRLDYRLRAEDLAPLTRLCRLVGGSPLALELAAVWVRSLPVAEIAREIGNSLDFLETTDRGKEPRHRSLRAVFEHSWRRLSPPEQQTLRRLAVFPGSFRLEAARSVAGASLPTLAALVDASLLRLTSEDRYSRHALLHQYMREKLAEAPLEAQETERLHHRHYLALLAERGDAILGPQGGEALSVLDEELENIRAAWEHASTCDDDLQQGVVQAALYYDRRARFQEGFEAYGRAAVTLQQRSPRSERLIGDLLVRQGWFAMRLGRHGEARRLAFQGLGQVPPESVSAIHAHNAVGNAAERMGDYPQAEAHLREALRLAGLHRLLPRQADLSAHLAAVVSALGRYAEAGELLGAALALYGQLSYQVGTVFGLVQQGQMLLNQGILPAAEHAFRRALKLARDLGVHPQVPAGLQGLAGVAFGRGQYDEAKRLGEEALAQLKMQGHPSGEASVLGLLGRTSVALHAGAQARSQLQQALSVAWANGETPRLLELLAYLGEWRLGRGETQEAAFLLRLVSEHPAAEDHVRALARRLQEPLARQLPAEEPPLPPLETVVARVLEDIGLSVAPA